MGEIMLIVLRAAAVISVLFMPSLMRIKKESSESFCAGFCVAEAVARLCGRCAWMYAVVFGEVMGLIMLAVTMTGAILLFELLSGKNSGLLLTALYIFFSSADSEYLSVEKPIINGTAEGVRIGCVGLSDAVGKRTALLIACTVFGGIISLFGTRIPAAFSVIAACGLLSKGMKGISSNRYCIAGAASACILAYL